MDYVEIKCDQCCTSLKNISCELGEIITLLVNKENVHAAIRLDRLNQHLKECVKGKVIGKVK